MSPDLAFVRNYLETFFSLPWNDETIEALDLKYITNILNKSHYGLKEVKEAAPYQNEVVITCRAGKSSAWINWQGRMTPCVMMEYPAISLKEVSAKKAWKNLEEMMKELPAHSDCKRCKLWKLCQACYASVSLEKEHNGNVSYLCRFTQCEYDFLKQLINK